MIGTSDVSAVCFEIYLYVSPYGPEEIKRTGKNIMHFYAL